MEAHGNLFGYARVSTEDQKLDLQVNALIKAGVEESRIKTDTITGSHMSRPGLQELIRRMWGGDTLVVWKIDRLGRSVAGVLETIKDLEERGIGIRSITEGFDSKTIMGRAMMQILLVFAEMERSLISERTKEGMKAARARGGKKPGREHSVLGYPKRIAKFEELFDAEFLHKDGSTMSLSQICDELRDADPKSPMAQKTSWFSNWKRDDFKGFIPQKDKPLEDES